MKTIGFWIYDTYNFFFSLKVNPLRFIPNAFTQYILMFYLSVMWTVVFTLWTGYSICLLYTSPSPRDLSTSRMASSA